MNDKDKEAFEKWWDEYPMGWKISGELHKNTSDSWQAACEYKQKEIDDLTGQLKSCIFVYEEKVNRLIAENKKLREALEKIAYHVGKFPIYESYCELSHIAREALKEVGEK
jgi:hypothetical protein